MEKPRALLLARSEPEEHHAGADVLAAVSSLTVGYLRDVELWREWGLKGGLGADVTFYRFPDSLRPAYGDSPVSVHAFLRVRWGKPHGADHGAHMGHGMTR